MRGIIAGVLLVLTGCAFVRTRPPETFPIVAVYPERSEKNAYVGTSFPIRSCSGECKLLTTRHLLGPGRVGVLVRGLNVPISDDPDDFDPRREDARQETIVNDWIKLLIPTGLEVNPVETTADTVPPFGTRSIIVGYPKQSEVNIVEVHWKRTPTIIRCRVIDPKWETSDGSLALLEYSGISPVTKNGFSGSPVAIVNADGSIGPVWGIFIGEYERATVYKTLLPPFDFITFPVRKTIGVVIPLRRVMLE